MEKYSTLLFQMSPNCESLCRSHNSPISRNLTKAASCFIISAGSWFIYQWRNWGWPRLWLTSWNNLGKSYWKFLPRVLSASLTYVNLLLLGPQCLGEVDEFVGWWLRSVPLCSQPRSHVNQKPWGLSTDVVPEGRVCSDQGWDRTAVWGPDRYWTQAWEQVLLTALGKNWSENPPDKGNSQKLETGKKPISQLPCQR